MRIFSNKLPVLVLCACTWFVAAATAGSPVADGPYVLRGQDGGWIAQWAVRDATTAQVQRKNVDLESDVRVEGVGALPAFDVRLRGEAETAPSQVAPPADVPVFIVADTHGEYEILVELLQSQRIIDAELRWTYGTGHLVFLGDVFDRGSNQMEILWLTYKLEHEALQAGGGTHLLLGNHEAIVLQGDERYLHPKYLETAKAFGAEKYADLFAAETLLGQWLRSKAAVLKFNRTLLVHGGISPDLVNQDISLDDINRAVRDALAGQEDSGEGIRKFVTGTKGPLWYRGYFPMRGNPPEADSADIDHASRHFGVDRILVGHTPVPTVTALYEGRVIAVQVYLERDKETGEAIIEGVVLQDGIWYRGKVDGTREVLLP